MLFPAAYAGIVLLVRARVPRFHASLWLDGAIGALAIAAVGAAVMYRAIERDHAGRRRSGGRQCRLPARRPAAGRLRDRGGRADRLAPGPRLRPDRARTVRERDRERRSTCIATPPAAHSSTRPSTRCGCCPPCCWRSPPGSRPLDPVRSGSRAAGCSRSLPSSPRWRSGLQVYNQFAPVNRFAAGFATATLGVVIVRMALLFSDHLTLLAGQQARVAVGSRHRAR